MLKASHAELRSHVRAAFAAGFHPSRLSVGKGRRYSFLLCFASDYKGFRRGCQQRVCKNPANFPKNGSPYASQFRGHDGMPDAMTELGPVEQYELKKWMRNCPASALEPDYTYYIRANCEAQSTEISIPDKKI